MYRIGHNSSDAILRKEKENEMRTTECKNGLRPCVFAVNDTYQILIPVERPSMMWVQVGAECYYDESNGILRSQNTVHKMIVPMEELNRAGKYTVYERVLIERKPYFSETEELQEYEYSFYPVKADHARAYHIADAHNMVEAPVQAAREYGEFDFLILNGDVPEDSGAVENFDVIYQIVYELTGGEKPTVFSRGNHDLRGIHAERLVDFTPNDNGKTYYTFKLGSIWGIVLDCGEDKEDSHAEYGHTVCCHAFRKRQTEFIRNVIRHAESEYAQEDVKTKLVIVHNPFTEQSSDPFNIEETLYREWAELLKNNVKPDAMLCGHYHQLYVSLPGDQHDFLGHPCPVIVGAAIDRETHYFAGCGLEFNGKAIEGAFTSSDGTLKRKFAISEIAGQEQ